MAEGLELLLTQRPLVPLFAVGTVVAIAWYLFTSNSKGKAFLDKTRQEVPLIDKKQLSHDTFRYRFGLPNSKDFIGLPVGKHFKVFGKCPKPSAEGQWNGTKDDEVSAAEIERKYTPTSSDDDLGYVDLVIKVYRPGKTYDPPRDRFTDGGKLSQFVDSLKIGDKLTIQGPFGHIEYKGMGQFEVMKKQLPLVKKVGMVAGGTGITPMLQIIKAILKNKADKTEVSLLFANQTEDDILVRDMLEEEKKSNPDRLQLHYTLDRPPSGWKGFTGFITEEMLGKTMPGAQDDSVILMCGPPVMLDRAVRPNLEKLGFGKAQMLAF